MTGGAITIKLGACHDIQNMLKFVAVGSIPKFLMKKTKALCIEFCLCMPSHMNRLLGFGLCCFGHKRLKVFAVL